MLENEPLEPPIEAPATTRKSPVLIGFLTGWAAAWGFLAAGCVLLLLIVLSLALLRKHQGQPRPGQKAPAFTLTTFENQQVSLDSLKGKVVVLNFWASWCVTCKDEATLLEEAWQQYHLREDVVFLGVAWTDTDSKAKEYIKRYHLTYQNGPDLGTRISQKYRITGVPETYIIDKNGVLADVHLVPFSSTREITGIIDPLLVP
jgi:cytochrome c biogenesis protein CcmG/thiol:disulfide interchange protein DsbE